MTRTLVAALALVAAPAFAADAPVATLSGQQGTVLVNQGEVFVTAVDGQALNPGDRVLVMAGGEATLAFTDGCQLPLAGGSLLEVPAVSTWPSVTCRTRSRSAPRWCSAPAPC